MSLHELMTRRLMSPWSFVGQSHCSCKGGPAPRLALERTGWQVVFANDIDEDKAVMYRQNWPGDNHLVVEDIHKLHVDNIPTCDLFTASFPCNDLSIAGRWEGLSGKDFIWGGCTPGNVFAIMG